MKLSDRQRKLALVGAGAGGLVLFAASRRKTSSTTASYAPVAPSELAADTVTPALSYGSVTPSEPTEPAVTPGAIVDAVSSAWALLEALGLYKRPEPGDSGAGEGGSPAAATPAPKPAETPKPVVLAAPPPGTTAVYVGGPPTAPGEAANVNYLRPLYVNGVLNPDHPDYVQEQQRLANNQREAEERRARERDREPAPQMYGPAPASGPSTPWPVPDALRVPGHGQFLMP